MIKSESQIERDFFRSVKDSDLGKAIKGAVYRPDMRPDDAKTEDIVITFISGVDGQTQEGIVIVNVYVPDVAYNGKFIKAHDRIATLQAMIPNLIETTRGNDYHIETDGTSKTYAIEEIKQHSIAIRLKFKCLTD